jgi:hypothetical protein
VTAQQVAGQAHDLTVGDGEADAFDRAGITRPAADALAVAPALADGELATLDGGKPAQLVTLGPFGIKVLRIAGRRQPPGEERDLWP